MKTWFRWMLLILSIGGGFMGLAMTMQAAFKLEAGGFLAYLVCGVAMAFYIFTILAGLLFAEDSRRITLLRVAFILQIPRISSPVLVYGFSSGFRVSAGLGLSDGKFTASFRFGSDFDFFIFGRHPLFVGANIFAVLILILLARYGRMPATALESAAIGN